MIIADLHIHSKYSRACSKDLTIPNLVKWAKIKGLNLLGSGDFTHPEWFKELSKLKEKNGIFYYEDFPFILSSEISLVYTQNDKGRRVHLVYLAPSLESVSKINSWLDTKGRRDYDGRPIFKISCSDFAAKMKEIDERIEIIPAHIYTPYFGIFGSKGGFDSLKEAFGDNVDKIHAIETGISSDPKMNWQIKDLDNISIVSFSDSHSFWPWRLGREATIFNSGELSYDFIIKQIRENSFIGTVETEPAYGKYHYDGHAGCEFSCSPEESRKINGICPKCKGKLTIGVENRVEELSGDANHKNKKKYYTLLPLHEIISFEIGAGVNTKKVWDIYNKLIGEFSNEFNILINVPYSDLIKVVDVKLANIIIINREGKLKIKPGYDGVYGEIILGDKEIVKKQKSLNEF